MPRYIYTAKSQPEKTTEGIIEADSDQEAINKLTKMGYFPISVSLEEVSAGKLGLIRLSKISKKEIASFTRQLSTLIDSGVNILNAFSIISDQSSNKQLVAVLSDISSMVKDGKSLSESFAVHQLIFPNLYCAMVRTGEASGDLNLTLKRLADFLEQEEEFKDSLRASLTYPFFVFFVSALTVIVLLTFVIPRLVTMFEDMGQALPLPTMILINLSSFLRDYWWMILSASLAAMFLLARVYKTANGRLYFDSLRLKVPAFRDLVLKNQTSRLMRTLSLLLSSGTPITQALDISSSVLDNQVLKSEVLRFKDNIASGSSLSDSFKNSKLFPSFVTNIVVIGEESGALDKSLMRLSQEYDRQVDKTVKGLTRLLEPAIILVMGIIVGFIVLSMLLPIFQINLIVK